MRRKQTQRTPLHSAVGVDIASGVPTVSAAAIATSAIAPVTTTSRSKPPAIESQSTTTAPTKAKRPASRSRTPTSDDKPQTTRVATPTRRSSTRSRGSTPTRSSTPGCIVEPAKGTKSRPTKGPSPKSAESAKQTVTSESASKPKSTETSDTADADESAAETRRNRAPIVSIITAASNATSVTRRPSPASGKSPSASTQPKQVTPTSKKASPSTGVKRTQSLTLGVSADGRLIATKSKEPPKVSKALTLEEQVAREIDLLPVDVTKRYDAVLGVHVFNCANNGRITCPL